MSTEIIPRESSLPSVEDAAMNLESVVRQVTLIQDVMHKVMRKDEHYGIIPGTAKPTLYKPGAEKLGLTFRFSPTYQIERVDLQGGHREYIVTCTLTHIPSGLVVGQGVGSCSSMESKYRYRKAEQKCPVCEKEAIIKGKKEYGGGWLCYAKKGGCGTKYKDGDERIENQMMGRVEHPDPADYWNTILKMAKKRAHVDATLTATAASDIFTQDVEDLPEFSVEENGKPEPRKNTKSSNGEDVQRSKANAAIWALAAEKNLDDQVIKDFSYSKFDKQSMTDLTVEEMRQLYRDIKSGEVAEWFWPGPADPTQGEGGFNADPEEAA